MKGEPIREEKEVRIDLPVKAFIPADWVGQEALRLELYRKIGTARDHAELDQVRAEAEDRYGDLPPSVRTLFAVASLKITARGGGIEEIVTFRNQVRIRPVEEAMGLETSTAMQEASYHSATRTMNLLQPAGMGGEALTRWVEDVLRRSAAREPAAATAP